MCEIIISLCRPLLLWFFILVQHQCGWVAPLTIYHRVFPMLLHGGSRRSALLISQIKAYWLEMDSTILTVKHRKNLHSVWLNKRFGQGRLHLDHGNTRQLFHRSVTIFTLYSWVCTRLHAAIIEAFQGLKATCDTALNTGNTGISKQRQATLLHC